MRTLRFEYRMELKFSSPVNRHYFALRCVPGDSLRQKVCLEECLVEPADYLREVKDGFGNNKLTGCCGLPHDVFRYRIRGLAQVENGTGDRAPLHPIYRYPSKYTAFEPEVAAFGREVLEECAKRGLGGAVERAVCAMNMLYERFDYVPGTTHIWTTAAQALVLGKGVCQDYAHIMTAVLRYMGIPARYVNGLMIGEGYTHAWVEVYGENGWYGLDPTNNLHIDDYYIKLAHGRDYGDCPVDKGIFWGNAAQKQEIYVNVEEVGYDPDSSISGTAGR